MIEKRPLPLLTLATKVTLLRILGVPVFVLLTIYYTMSLRTGAPQEMFRVAALVVFLAVALTDALDGYLARSRNEVTALGRILDPIADKLLLLSATLMLTRPGLPQLHPQLPVWFTLTVISRDVLLVAGALVVHHLAHTVAVHPRISGKIATFLQMASIVWVLSDAAVEVLPWLVGAAALFTLISGLHYTLDGIRQVEHVAHPRPAVSPPGPR